MRKKENNLENKIFNSVRCHGVQNLYKSLESSLLIIRMARATFLLNPAVDLFYDYLDEFEKRHFDFMSSSASKLPNNDPNSFLVAIEGLPGVGKVV
jgi:hypothetical protein